jgi:hypothetical protein
MGAIMKHALLDLQIGFFVVSLVLAYFYWIRPILKTRPGCASFYASTDSWLAAIRLRFQGIKGHIATGIAKAAALIVLVHDQVLPYATGVDWTPIVSQVPGWSWPLITFGAFFFIGKCREWAEERT